MIGRIACEGCDAEFTDVGPSGDDSAIALGWTVHWDGWICPTHSKELQEDYEDSLSLEEE